MAKETISPLIIERLPEFLNDFYPQFVKLLQYYYEWSEEDGNFTRVLLDHKNNMNLSGDNEEYINLLLSEMGFKNHDSIKINKTHFAYFLRDFYLSQGSDLSYKFLFKTFFNSDVDVNYPRVKLLRSSHINYSSISSLYTFAINKNTPEYKRIITDKTNYSGILVQGLNSNVTFSVEDISEFELNGVFYLKIDILYDDLFQKYYVDEPVRIKYGDISFVESILSSSDLSIDSGGSGYSVGDLVNVSASSTDQIFTGTYLINSVKKSGIDGYTIVSGGIGYLVNDMVFAETSKDGSGFSGFVKSVNGFGAITSIGIINRGYGYSKTPSKLIVKSSTGAGANLIPTSSTIGEILSIVPINPLIFNSPTTTNVSIQSSGSGAVITVIPQSVFTETKTNKNPNNGILGRYAVLTDSNFFQQFSYELKTDVSFNVYDPVVKSIHPVGYSKFNILAISTTDNLNLSVIPSSTGSSVSAKTKLWFSFNLNSLLTASSSLTQIKTLTEGVTSFRVNSLSINNIDQIKFSANIDQYPLNYNLEVINSVNNNSFLNSSSVTVVTLI